MNLLFVTPDFLPAEGGISSMSHHLAASMAKRCENVYVLAPGEKHRSDDQSNYKVIRDSEACLSKMSGKIWESVELPRLIALLKNVASSYKIDRILSLHPHYYGQALATLKQARLKDREDFPAFDSIYHGLELLSCFKWPKIKESLLQKYFQKIPSHRDAVFNTVKASEFVFCNSHFTQGLVKRIDPNAQVAVIGCGVPQILLDRYSDISESERMRRRIRARQTLKLPEEVTIIGYLGRLVAHKNVEALLKLAEKSPSDVHVLIGGNGPMKSWLEAWASEKEIQSRVHFRSLESETVKRLAFESLDQFCLMSKQTREGGVEGFGIVLLEAMATGIPVLSSGQGGTIDVFQDRISGRYVNLKVPGEFEKISRELMETKDQRNKMITQAQLRVNDHFTWTKVAERIFEVWSIELP